MYDFIDEYIVGVGTFIGGFRLQTEGSVPQIKFLYNCSMK